MLWRREGLDRKMLAGAEKSAAKDKKCGIELEIKECLEL